MIILYVLFFSKSDIFYILLTCAVHANVPNHFGHPIPDSWRAFREAKKDTAAQTARTRPTSAWDVSHSLPITGRFEGKLWKAIEFQKWTDCWG